MDRPSPFVPSIPCVRCGAHFPLVHLLAPCPRCGLPARFSLPWQNPDNPSPQPAAPSGGQDLVEAAAPATSSSRIPVASAELFSGDELQSLLRLRERYQLGDTQVCDDEFTAEERARLMFMRWLYRSGRVTS